VPLIFALKRNKVKMKRKGIVANEKSEEKKQKKKTKKAKRKIKLKKALMRKV
jgi:hypothetical protein